MARSGSVGEWQYSVAMSLGQRAVALAASVAVMVVGLIGLAGVAPATAAAPYVASTAIQRGTTWLPFSDTPTYANEPKLLPGTHNFRVTMTNNTSLAFSITSVVTGIPAAPTACSTAPIQPTKSASCIVPVDITTGLLSFSTAIYLSNGLEYATVFHKLIGVSYDLHTTMTLTTPGGIVSPGDPSLLALPLGYRPTATIVITNGSTVAITGVTVPGFDTQGCASILKSIAPFAIVTCIADPVNVPASVSPINLTTGAVGNGVFAGDRPGLGVSLSYQGVGGCTASVARLTAGTTQSVACTGFAPGIAVGTVLHSTPVSVGSHIVAGDGSLDFSFVVPVTTSGGAHTVGITVDGSTVASTPAFSVTAVAQLPETGVDPAAAVLVAVLLLLLGAGLLGVRHALLRVRAT